MKVNTPEIAWHARDPIYSCDVQPHQGGKSPLRIATAGTDSNIRIWYIHINNENKGTPEFASNLSRHNKAVNCVRWSLDGKILASGADDGCIILWRLSDTQGGGVAFGKEDEEVSKEGWNGFKTLRGHIEDVYDLCWSSDGSRLISGSVDNSAILWDINKGEKLHLFKDHRSFVQGVAYDPRDQMCATISCDRSLRLYNLKNYRYLYNISKMPITTTNNEGESQTKQCRMFHDDTMKSFFRRLAFTPDGEILIVPAGSLEMGDSSMNTTFMFTRTSFPRPVVHLPGPSKATVAVRCCPVLYELRKSQTEEVSEPMDTSEPSEKTDASKEDKQTESKESEKNDSTKNLSEQEEETKKTPEVKPQSLFNLPYRVVFAVATEDSVMLYDTQQNIPFAAISNLHYHQLSDLSWSSDGKLLVVASTDGYCTLIAFEDGELGVPYKDPSENVAEEAKESTKITSDTSNQKSPKVTDESSKAKEEKSNLGTNSTKNQETEKVITTPPDNQTSQQQKSAVTDSKPMEVEKTVPVVAKTTSPSGNLPGKKGTQPRRIQVTTLTSSAPQQNNSAPAPRRVSLTTISTPQPTK